MVKQQGFKVYPREVETIVRSHPDVEDACMFAVADEENGESVALAIITVANKTLSFKEILEFCRKRMPFYQIPRYVNFVNRFSLTNAGKIDKAALAKQFQF